MAYPSARRRLHVDGNGTDLGRSITQQARQNKPSGSAFASAAAGAYLEAL